jgi:hypothetical protein
MSKLMETFHYLGLNDISFIFQRMPVVILKTVLLLMNGDMTESYLALRCGNVSQLDTSIQVKSTGNTRIKEALKME